MRFKNNNRGKGMDTVSRSESKQTSNTGTRLSEAYYTKLCVCGQLKWLPAKRDSVFHFQDGFPQVATYSPSL